MDCSDIHQPQHLTRLCMPGRSPEELNDLFKCFYRQFFTRFEKYARKYFYITDDQHIQDAFTDGLLAFYFRVQNEGFADKGASVETVLIEYCRRKLLGIFTARGRHDRKNIYMDFAELPDHTSNDDPLPGEDSLQQTQEEALQKAWQTLGKRCSNLLLWRKIEKLKKEVVAARMSIEAGTVNNEVYKCFGRLLKIIQSDRQ